MAYGEVEYRQRYYGVHRPRRKSEVLRTVMLTRPLDLQLYLKIGAADRVEVAQDGSATRLNGDVEDCKSNTGLY